MSAFWKTCQDQPAIKQGLSLLNCAPSGKPTVHGCKVQKGRVALASQFLLRSIPRYLLIRQDENHTSHSVHKLQISCLCLSLCFWNQLPHSTISTVLLCHISACHRQPGYSCQSYHPFTGKIFMVR